jgi:hypothetical protein
MPKKEKKKAQNFSRADSAQYLFIYFFELVQRNVVQLLLTISSFIADWKSLKFFGVENNNFQSV